MDVFELRFELEPPLLDLSADVFESLYDLAGVLAGNDALLRQHAGMGRATLDVILVETAVK